MRNEMRGNSMDFMKYPGRYELQQALQSEFCLRGWLDSFSQEQGVFLTNANQDDLTLFLSGLFYEYTQLEQIRRNALQLNSNNVLYGFRIETDDAQFDLTDKIDKYRGQVVDEQNQMKVKALTEQRNNDDVRFHGVIEYLQQKPGRIQFLQGTERAFNYYVKKIDTSQWEVLVDCSRSNDGRLMEDWLKRELPRHSNIVKVEQETLTTKQTIQFFDNLGSEGAGLSWRLTQVKRIVLRKDNDNSNEDSEEMVETSESVLSGITQAILEGNELRDNSFVKQCEEGGYRFTAMTYEYEDTVHPYVKEIRAEFKQRPKVFEISLHNFSKRVGVNDQLAKHILNDEDRIALLSQFWGRAKNVFDKITSPTQAASL